MARYPEPSLHYCRTEAMGKNHRAPDKEINARALGILRIHRASVAKWTAEEPARLTAQLIDRCALAHADMTSTNDEQHTRQSWAVRNVLEKRGAEYPAEHNVGHLYQAKPDLAEFYKSVDPTNSMNPGIGKMSKKKNYA